MQDSLALKQARTSALGKNERQVEETSTTVVDPIQSWVLNQKWPSEYFEADRQVKEELFERDSGLEEMMEQQSIPKVQYVERNGFRYPLPLQKIPFCRTQSNASQTESGDWAKRESEYVPYADSRYAVMLEMKGSHMHDFDFQAPASTTKLSHDLLADAQTVPRDSLFRDDLFGRLCSKLQSRNDAMIIQDITRLIVPSAMNLAIYGDTHLNILIESVNEAWSECIPIEGLRPQPDYAVGFDRAAFTDKQLQKLKPLIGSPWDTSFFVAMRRMYFSFLTCEVKSLDIADKRNAHSMTVAVRGVVELYRAVKRQKELDRIIPPSLPLHLKASPSISQTLFPFPFSLFSLFLFCLIVIPYRRMTLLFKVI